VEDVVGDVGDEEGAGDDEGANMLLRWAVILRRADVAEADERKMAQRALRTASSAGGR
jgi:hypothetical protein